MEPKVIRVLLVDDHTIVRGGIRRLLNDVPDVEVCGEAATGEEALRMVEALRPDVVLMDVNMPGIGGVEATRRLLQRNPHARIIVLTVHNEQSFARRLLESGVSGYLTKGSDVEEMVTALRRVHAGDYYIALPVAQALALSSSVPGKGENPFDRLSKREFQVMFMIAQGLSNQEISERLCLSPKTVSTYRSRLLEKLDVQTEVELIRLAVDFGVIDLGKISETQPPPWPMVPCPGGSAG